MSNKPLYKRVLIKLSGEALLGQETFGIDPQVLTRLVEEMASVVALGVEVGVVIGGGNLFRGKKLSQSGLDRITGDQMGMLATMMNALALRDAFEQAKIHAHIMSAIGMAGLVEYFNRRDAMRWLKEGHVVIMAGGTGHPLVTTDSAASLRAIEIEADVLLKATQVDGVYSADPAQDPNATRFKHLTYKQVLQQELAIMDLSAFCQCRDYHMPIRIFNIHQAGNLKQVVLSESVGTLISGAAHD